MISLKDILKEVLDSNLLESDKDRIIYLDLDGVLVDFDRGFKEISNGISKFKYIKIHGYPAFWKLINQHGENWWASLKWMHDGQSLWNVLKDKNVVILTSGSKNNTGTLADSGKRKWVSTHLGEIKTIVVNSSIDKKNYARPGDILIDDLPVTIDEWNTKHGLGILHTSTENTLRQLNNILTQQVK